MTRRDDSLVLSLGPAKTEYSLCHWDGNVFTLEPSGENASAGSGSKVTFTIRPPRQAVYLAIEFFENGGWSSFTRR